MRSTVPRALVCVCVCVDDTHFGSIIENRSEKVKRSINNKVTVETEQNRKKMERERKRSVRKG